MFRLCVKGGRPNRTLLCNSEPERIDSSQQTQTEECCKQIQYMRGMNRPLHRGEQTTFPQVHD